MGNTKDAPTSDRVRLWCHDCKAFVEHRATSVDVSRKPHVLHVSPEALTAHRATHKSPPTRPRPRRRGRRGGRARGGPT